MPWSEVTSVWSEVTSVWGEVTFVWGEMTSIMGRTDFWLGRSDWWRNDHGAMDTHVLFIYVTVNYRFVLQRKCFASLCIEKNSNFAR